MDEIPKSLQVYVVEDSPIIRRLLTSTIEAAQAELVGHSASAQKAIADLEVLQPDLVVIDIALDSGTGFDVLRALQERGLAQAAVKVVLTNRANAEYRDLSYRLGADSFFDKSAEISQVLALITALAGERRPRGASEGNGDHHDPGQRKRS
jgi:DNA-binding NarL/FixJ family response regulator